MGARIAADDYVSAVLAGFAAESRWEDMPDIVRHVARRSLAERVRVRMEEEAGRDFTGGRAIVTRKGGKTKGEKG